ncbi:terminase small subunit [Psychrobacillus sp. L3]|uniref:terminase small subunit n=1 Tax=Psychrobacillus sp. L3 TaxID=3236891 RepID=UPI0036F22554
MIERNLNPKQQAFADYYIELGNAEEAALKAGYSKAYSRGKAYTLLANVGIQSYIENRMEELKSERIADQQEILETLTAILRGEVNGATLIGLGMGEQDISENMKPSVAEKIKAAELLGKRYKLWIDRTETEIMGTVQFIDDISGEVDGC